MRNTFGYILGFLVFAAEILLLTLQVRSEEKRLERIIGLIKNPFRVIC